MQFLKNILFAIIISALGLFALDQAIGWYTRHGVRIKVPNVSKLNYQEAIDELEDLGLEPIIQDSVYSGDFKKMAITEQSPLPGREVKEGRKVYLTINSLPKPKVRMPKLKDNSINLAKALLTNSGLELGNITEKPSLIGSGIVLKQLFRSDTIVSGKLIERGSKIDLWVSKFVDIDSVYLLGDDTNHIHGWQFKDGLMNEKLRKKYNESHKNDSLNNANAIKNGEDI